MGNICKPAWKKTDEFKAAYVYEEFAFCRPKTFVYRCPDNKSKGDDLTDSWETSPAKPIVEEQILDPLGRCIQCAQEVPVDCCRQPDYTVAVESFNREIAPELNRKIQSFGFELDGFQWMEHRYVSTGQYGGTVVPIPHFCIRVKKLENEKDMDEAITMDGRDHE